jgi:hypothetical protein
LIQAVWIRSDAAAKGLSVSPQRVRRTFERQKQQAFESERQFRRFLREAGATEADILNRVELDLLQVRLLTHAADQARPVGDGAVNRSYSRHRDRWKGVPRVEAKRKIRRLLERRRGLLAIGRYIQDFRSRYRAITACAPGYEIPECGAAPLSLIEPTEP